MVMACGGWGDGVLMYRFSSFFGRCACNKKEEMVRNIPSFYRWHGFFVTFCSLLYESMVAKRCHLNDKDEERGRKNRLYDKIFWSPLDSWGQKHWKK